MLIALDAGHGRYTAGKRTPHGIHEWELNSRIADILWDMLEKDGHKVIRMDDTTGNTDISLYKRVNNANTQKADIYISIHHNAGINGGTGGGTVVYYCSSKTVRPIQAQSLYDNIVACTGLVGNRSQKVIKKAFYVIKNTKMPAFLIENGFMDSKTDEPIIISKKHAELTAQGIYNFIKEVKNTL